MKSIDQENITIAKFHITGFSYVIINAIICDIFYSSMIRELVQTKYRFVQSTDLITTGYRQEPTTGYYNDMKNYFVLLCQF